MMTDTLKVGKVEFEQIYDGFILRFNDSFDAFGNPLELEISNNEWLDIILLANKYSTMGKRKRC